MNYITHSLVGETLFVEFEIEGDSPAYLDKWTKRPRKATPQLIESLKAKPEGGTKTGTVSTKGKVVVSIPVKELLYLGWAASSNVNKTSKYGAARAKFLGTVKFTEDAQ